MFSTRQVLFIVAIVVIPLLAGIAALGCGQVEKQDAHRTPANQIDRTPPALVVTMPEDFGNIVIKCDRWGHRIYVTSNPGTNSASNVYVINDPTCPGGQK